MMGTIEIPDDANIEEIVGVMLSLSSAPNLLVREIFPDQMIVCGETFNRVPGEEMLGFYDWIRDNDKEIIGVRLVLSDPGFLDLGQFSKLKNVCVNQVGSSPEPHLQIFFDASRNPCEEYSDDCDFGGNYLYVGDGGTIILTFCAPQDFELQPAS